MAQTTHTTVQHNFLETIMVIYSCIELGLELWDWLAGGLWSACPVAVQLQFVKLVVHSCASTHNSEFVWTVFYLLVVFGSSL